MPTTQVDDITLHFDTFGSAQDPTLLLVAGLGAQMTSFEDELCEQLAALGTHVVRFDNRDAGLSTHLDGVEVDVLGAVSSALGGGPVDGPYDLSDMAADAMAVLDALEVETAHVLGTSMGGMIAQTITIDHPRRVRSLVSVYSTTGEPDVGTPDPEVLASMLGTMSPAEDRDARIESSVELARLISTAWCFDEERTRRKAAESIDRAYNPDGTARQLVAILSSGSRAAHLPNVTVPTLVLHGDEDPLVNHSGGVRTAELIPGAELRTLQRMGHDLPPEYWHHVTGAVTDVMRSATSV
jgi:pimeloyl-ACP methyl ester carboxylesterase